MRILPIALAFALVATASSAHAFTTRLLDGAERPEFGLLDAGLVPATPALAELFLDEGGGDGASQVVRPLMGYVLAIVGGVLTFGGGVLVYALAPSVNSDGSDSWAGGIVQMMFYGGLVILGGGVAALVASGFMLFGASGSAGDAPIAVAPPARAESDRLAKADVRAAPLSMAWAF